MRRRAVYWVFLSLGVCACGDTDEHGAVTDAGAPALVDAQLDVARRATPDARAVDAARDAAPEAYDAAPEAVDAAPEAFDAAPVAVDARLDASTSSPVRHVYPFTDARLPNPDRGFYRFVVLTDPGQRARFPEIFADGHRLVFSYVRLDAFRDRPLTPELLAEVTVGLDAARAAGLSVILRFAYNEGPWPDSEPDAPLEVVLGHVEEVAPLLDHPALLVLQAGFIGAWGEWHTSTNELLAHRQVILDALLALPPRWLQLRYPPHKAELVGGPAAAVSADPVGRVGHHNDCFLASETDFGTWPEDDVEAWKLWVERDSRHTLVGGETCNPSPRAGCDTALAELARFHYGYLNLDYHPEVIEGWRAGGCFDEIDRRLGYRLRLLEVTFPEVARDRLSVRLRIENAGWAAPPRARPVELRLGDARVALEADLTTWAPGVVELVGELDVRAVERGEHALRLALPDPLAPDRAELAVRLANEGLWARGEHRLGVVRLE